MTATEAVQLLFILVGVGIAYRWLWTWNSRMIRRVSFDTHATTFPVTHTGSMFVPQFDKYAANGSQVFIPAGDGLYCTRIKRSRRARYKNGLKKWLDKKEMTIHLVITLPSDAARKEWQSLKDEYPDRFCVYLLHREKVTEPSADMIKSQIASLDTYHPSLLVNPPGTDCFPGAMWIEAFHPVGSKFAYHVEFVPPAVAVNDERFDKYRQLYKAILQGPYVEQMQKTARSRIAA
ncbi:MAG TPA: hypothetical protein VMF53_15980 [Alphaproteobacteria bacterium]|nr:hypothetical protein [Alphaproteobacteria bacterium]